MRMTKTAAFFSIWFLSAGLPSSAVGEEPPVFRPELDESQLGRDPAHYNLFMLGKKIGWMSETLRRQEFQGEEVYAVDIDFHQSVLNDGEALTMRSRDTEYYSAIPPYRLVAARSVTEQNGFQSSIMIRRKAAGSREFVADITGGKAERSKELGEIDLTLSDAMAVDVWCARGPEAGEAVRIRELDFTDLEARPSLFTLRRILPEEGEGAFSLMGRTARYELDYFDEVGKTKATFLVDQKGQLLKGNVSGAVELVRATAADAKKLEANLDLFESSLIKIAQPLGDASSITELVLEVSGPGARLVPDGPNQDASYDAETQRTILKVGRAHGKEILVTEEERARALEETSVYPTQDPEVIALTERAIGRATRPKAKIKRLVDFVDEFIIDDYANEPLSVNDIIETQRGDCSEHSQLFVTLARAAGIPAREVGGFIYGEGADYSFGGHAWCEVEVDGHWHPVDPSWGETVINATHIRISGDRPSSEEVDLYMGKLKFRVLSATDKAGRKRVFAKPGGE